MTAQPAPITQALPANVAALAVKIIEDNPMHRNFMKNALANVSAPELKHLDDYISFCIEKGLSVSYLADCYLTIVGDTLREQIFFQKHKKYRYSTFAEVANSVYFNEEYMSFYMYGLAITSYLWPNHLDLFRFFRDTLPAAREGEYLEIGPGHGYFFMTAMEQSSYSHFTGIDISETSIAMTRALIEHFGGGKKPFDLRCMDFLQCDLKESTYDAVVMGEVLEHVEDPAAFLKQIARIAKPGAHIFVTTCLNAPAVDHIYLFRSPAELADMFTACGLRIKKQLIRPYEGKTEAESMSAQLPVNVAYVLEKA